MKSVQTGVASLMSLASMAFCAPRQAAADVVAVTLAGTVTWGADAHGNVFSNTGISTDLTGDHFTLVYTIDDAKGTQDTYWSGTTPIGTYIKSDSSGNPITKAVLTINDHPLSLLKPPLIDSIDFYVKRYATSATSGADQFFFYLNPTYNVGLFHGYSTLMSAIISGVTFTTDFHWQDALFHTITGTDSSNGSFTYIHYATDGAGHTTDYQQATAYLLPQSISVTTLCTLPTGEITMPVGWDDTPPGLVKKGFLNPTVGKWKQTLTDSKGRSFFGRKVKEDEPFAGTDSCYFKNPKYLNPFPEAIHLSNPRGEWTVGTDNTWGADPKNPYDLVGWPTDAVNFYRKYYGPPISCGLVVYQQMTMSCPDGSFQNYGPINILKADITATTVTSSRAGVKEKRNYP
jgi:hypothetical protein